MMRHLLARALVLPLLLLPGCDNTVGEQPPDTDGGLAACEASQSSGVWLQPFGPVTHEINTLGQAKVMVVLVRRSQKEGDWQAVQGAQVNFAIITQGNDGTLDKKSVVTDGDGLAEALFTAGKEAPGYAVQVQASSTGTCAKTFSIEVKKALRQLRIVSPTADPFDTFTGAQVPVAVEATTDGYAKLDGEEVTFSFGTGSSSGTTFADVGGSSSGQATIKIKTNAAGRATAMVSTGSSAIPELTVKAEMSGTAEATVKLRVTKTGSGTTTCTSDADCPLGYACQNGKCTANPTTPTGGCKTDSDCISPNTCNTATGQCVPPATTPPGGCQSNSDCTPPNLCQTSTGQCLPPTGKTCDPVEGIGCATGEICIGRQCVKLPSGCTDNSQCPSGFQCVSGQCVPAGKPPTGGCVTNANCPSNQACINGQCVPKSSCTIVHQSDRLKGTWTYDSKLALRDALGGFVKGFLSLSGSLSKIINGTFSISGVPSWISSIVTKYLQKLISQYVPPWGQQLITALGNINDIIDDMRVVSTVQTSSTGTDTYSNSEQWDLLEFDYQGKKISSPPSAIPQIGPVKISAYASAEVCGVLFISKHKISNKIGGIIKWAIETALSLVTCNMKNTPCFNSVGQALSQTINCQMLGVQLDQMVQSIWSGAPSVASIVTQACNLEKNNLINKLNQELSNLTVNLSLLELSGTVTIPSPGQDNQLSNGVWFGWLGSGALKGDFKGSFSAKKAP